MNPHIEQAIQKFRANSVKYSKTDRYYRGDHDLSFATEKFMTAFGVLFRQFALNLCPAIVEAVRDKLKVKGFGVEEFLGAITTPSAKKRLPPLLRQGGEPDHPALRAPLLKPGGELADIHAVLDRIWRRNRMGVRAGEVHKEALKNGDGYAIIWWDSGGEVTIYPQRAANCAVCYDEDSPGRILWAAKHWRTEDKRVRLNLFYADRIEQYVTAKESEGLPLEAREFVPYGISRSSGELPPPRLSANNADIHPSSDRRGAASENHPVRRSGVHPSFVRRGAANVAVDASTFSIPNPFGVVPVFHFANNSDVGMAGRSELEQAIPVQDGLNKSVLDMLVAMEYSAYRQRWVAGLEVETDEATGKEIAPFKSGVDRLWIASDPAAKFGDFGTTELDQFLKVKDSFRVDMAGVTGTPLHYFLQDTRGFASGEALRKAETRFIAKVRDRQESFGQVWAELMSFALRLAGVEEKISLLTRWEDPAPLTEREFLENLLLKRKIGLPVEEALKEAGYGDEDAELLSPEPEVIIPV